MKTPPSKQVGLVAPREPLPTIALSVRQPWAWLIVNGHKDLENRSRSIGFYRGPILIHASATMTRGDYDACHFWVSAISSLIAEEIPDPDELHRGGIVGVTSIIDSTAEDCEDSLWWTVAGYSYRLDPSQSKPLPFKPCKGRLGFFPVDYHAL
jgi:hypothetical protein